LADVLPDGSEGAIVADDMVVAFGLPNCADMGHNFGDLFGAVAFDAVHYAAERPVLVFGFGQRLHQHVNVVGHDDEGEEVVTLGVEEEAGVEYNLSGARGKLESLPGVKGDEVDGAVIFPVGQHSLGDFEFGLFHNWDLRCLFESAQNLESTLVGRASGLPLQKRNRTARMAVSQEGCLWGVEGEMFGEVGRSRFPNLLKSDRKPVG